MADRPTLVWREDEGATLLEWDAATFRWQCSYLGYCDTFEGFRQFAREHQFEFCALPVKPYSSSREHPAARAARAQTAGTSGRSLRKGVSVRGQAELVPT